MARGRNRALGVNDISNILNDDSEIEDFRPSDEDEIATDDDYAFSPGEQSSSSDSSTSSDEEENVPMSRNRGNTLRLTSSRVRGIRRGRGRIPYNRQRPNDVPGTSGLTSTNWSINSFPPKEINLMEPAYLPIDEAGEDLLTYFRKYIDDDIVKTIVEKTNQTSVLKTGHNLNLTLEECYIYIGITLEMASLNYFSIRIYWANGYRVGVIADAMSRNRFLLIRQSLKIVFDSDITDEIKDKDKLWRVRPLITKVQTACRSEVKQQSMCIDEMIIPFTGSCGIRVYCPGKPNPVGIKAYVLARPDGMVCHFDIYEGKTTYPDYSDSEFGLGEKAVLSLADDLVAGHVLYFDRFFTCERLVDELKNRGIACTGTLMKNRIPKEVRCLLMSDRDMKRKGRGTSQVAVRRDGKIAVTKWFDNKPVYFMSSVEAKEEEDICQRWCKVQKKYIPVDRPRVVREYNKNMGGVDLADRFLANCPNRYRTRKWTQRFVSHMIDLSVSNAWISYKTDQAKKGVRKAIRLRQFKLDLGRLLIEKYYAQAAESTKPDEDDDIEPQESRKRRRGMPSVPIPSKIKRISQAKHLPVFHDVQGRCRVCHDNKTFFMCKSCNVRLCLTKKRNCYYTFHKE